MFGGRPVPYTAHTYACCRAGGRPVKLRTFLSEFVDYLPGEWKVEPWQQQMSAALNAQSQERKAPMATVSGTSQERGKLTVSFEVSAPLMLPVGIKHIEVGRVFGFAPRWRRSVDDVKGSYLRTRKGAVALESGTEYPEAEFKAPYADVGHIEDGVVVRNPRPVQPETIKARDLEIGETGRVVGGHDGAILLRTYDGLVNLKSPNETWRVGGLHPSMNVVRVNVSATVEEVR